MLGGISQFSSYAKIIRRLLQLTNQNQVYQRCTNAPFTLAIIVLLSYWVLVVTPMDCFVFIFLPMCSQWPSFPSCSLMPIFGFVPVPVPNVFIDPRCVLWFPRLVPRLVMYLKCCVPHVSLSGLVRQFVLRVSPASPVLPLVCLLKTVDCENSPVSPRSLLLRYNAVTYRDRRPDLQQI